MKTKICGLTLLSDAQQACELGAWAVGFVFVPESPRSITSEAAALIIKRLPAEVEKVGVFQNASVDTVKQTRDALGLTMVQLHGQETPEMVKAIGGRIIKAVRAKTEADIEALAKYKVEAFLIDGPGGGVTANWNLARLAKKFGPVILAGGLGKKNLSIAISSVQPFAVDISSSIEVTPGIKDPLKMKELFE